jgi:hypothetical protein
VFRLSPFDWHFSGLRISASFSFSIAFQTKKIKPIEKKKVADKFWYQITHAVFIDKTVEKAFEKMHF